MLRESTIPGVDQHGTEPRPGEDSLAQGTTAPAEMRVKCTDQEAWRPGAMANTWALSYQETCEGRQEPGFSPRENGCDIQGEKRRMKPVKLDRSRRLPQRECADGTEAIPVHVFPGSTDACGRG